MNSIERLRKILNQTKKNPLIGKKLIEKKYHFLNEDEFNSFYDNLMKNKFLFNINKECEDIIKKIENTFRLYKIEKEILYFFETYKMNYNQEYKKDVIYDIDVDFKENLYKKIKEIKNKENLLNALDLYGSEYEKIEDIITKRKNANELKKILNQELTSKNKLIMNNESFQLIKEITDEGISSSEFHDAFIKKISKFKNEEDINNALKNYLGSLRNWSIDYYLKKIDKKNDEYFEKDNVLYLKIKDYKQSNELGTHNWCISTSKYLFERYTSDFNRQYFIYDFNKDESDPMCMIGVTVDTEGTVINAHDKLDKNICNFADKKYEGFFRKYDKSELIKLISKSEEMIKFDLVEGNEDLFSKLIDDETFLKFNKVERNNKMYESIQKIKQEKSRLKVTKKIFNKNGIHIVRNFFKIFECFDQSLVDAIKDKFNSLNIIEKKDFILGLRNELKEYKKEKWNMLKEILDNNIDCCSNIFYGNLVLNNINKDFLEKIINHDNFDKLINKDFFYAAALNDINYKKVYDMLDETSKKELIEEKGWKHEYYAKLMDILTKDELELTKNSFENRNFKTLSALYCCLQKRYSKDIVINEMKKHDIDWKILNDCYDPLLVEDLYKKNIIKKDDYEEFLIECFYGTKRNYLEVNGVNKVFELSKESLKIMKNLYDNDNKDNKYRSRVFESFKVKFKENKNKIKNKVRP